MSAAAGTGAVPAQAYIPLLVNFSDEDKAARGLRKFTDGAPPPPAFFSALEMVRDHPVLLLTGDTGAGKSAFAQHLAQGLAAGGSFSSLLPRNGQGTVMPEIWEAGDLRPVCLPVVGEEDFTALLLRHRPDVHECVNGPGWQDSEASFQIIIDGLDKAGIHGPALLAQALAFQARYPRIRLLLLAGTVQARDWLLPVDLVRHALLPLLGVQRQAFADRLFQETGQRLSATALTDLAANPALFALAVASGAVATTEEELADAWLERSGLAIGATVEAAYESCAGRNDHAFLPAGGRRTLQLLAARYLLDHEADEAVAGFDADPVSWSAVLCSLISRRLASGLDTEPLMVALMAGEREGALYGALLCAGFLPPAGEVRVRALAILAQIVETGRLSAARREKAGRFLSRYGDRRDLQALADVPGGRFTCGSATHPNSAPVHTVEVGDFRIGRYPVVNGDYGAFVRETGRLWRSPDGFDPERLNAPATDLTWRDALAYCAWLTARWRAEKRIGAGEIVRLPTEPEWERAARGDRPDAGAEVCIYPWGDIWRDDAANSEEAGFNGTTAVGLFPAGRSPFGCLDMAGQIWEWCTTLWGEDMAAPSFTYPYEQDGREDAGAGPTVRRVLRGGCFSSGRLKANATYRGSLEPDGFWRGNGFRIVVAGA